MEKIKKLIDEIKWYEKNVVTDGYLMSLWELVNMYKSKELIINPKFQRIFRWTKDQKSKLIESLVLWLPLPWIFVAENEKWVWEVVDWLQRLSTILEFMKLLEWENYILTDNKIWNWLESTILLKNLEWIIWGEENYEIINEQENKTSITLPIEYKLRIKRTRIYVSILKNSWDLKAKYEVFQRLNTWWSNLSPQEVRNCIIIDKNEAIYDKIKILSENKNFINTIRVIWEQALLEKQDMELIFRYIALKNIDDFTNDTLIKDLIDSFIYKISWLENNINQFDRVNIDFNKEEEIFNKVFEFLNINIWEDVFYSRNDEWTVIMKRLKYPVFDTIAQWIAYNYEKWFLDFDRDKDLIINKIYELQKSTNYLSTEIYKNWNWSAKRLKMASNYWKKYFKII